MKKDTAWKEANNLMTSTNIDSISNNNIPITINTPTSSIVPPSETRTGVSVNPCNISLIVQLDTKRIDYSSTSTSYMSIILQVFPSDVLLTPLKSIDRYSSKSLN